jgi:hypothetical protein
MKRKLILALALVLVAFGFLAEPPASQADFCETSYGCWTVVGADYAECVCNRRFGQCTICCLDGAGCCWGSYYCTE